ncbi:MAG: phage holin family protein [Gemmatimonadaceae bacterium]
MEAHRVPIDPNTGIPDLIRDLADDSKRLLVDEVQLAKLETKDSLRRATKGALWLATAFGIGVVTLVALTLLLATLIGRLVNGHMWVGALVTGVLELGVAIFLFKRGFGALKQPSYTLEETRESVKDTARWAKQARSAAHARPS